MTKYLTVVPAYGRDYKSKAEVLSDWNAGKDFQICDMSSPHDGSYINKEDASKEGITVNVRYARLTKVLPIKNAA